MNSNNNYKLNLDDINNKYKEKNNENKELHKEINCYKQSDKYLSENTNTNAKKNLDIQAITKKYNDKLIDTNKIIETHVSEINKLTNLNNNYKLNLNDMDNK